MNDHGAEMYYSMQLNGGVAETWGLNAGDLVASNLFLNQNVCIYNFYSFNSLVFPLETTAKWMLVSANPPLNQPYS